jgi:hypothetical protein
MLKTLFAAALVAPLALLAAGIEPPAGVQDVLGRPTPPDAASLLLGAVVGLLVAFLAGAWAKRLDTLIHEFGHSIVALAYGGRVHWVVLHRGGGGLMSHSGPGSVAVSLAGYLSPALVAGSLLLATAHGLIRAWLAYMALVLALGTVLKVRNVYGWAVGVLAVAGLGGAAYAVDREVLTVAGFALGVALGVSGLRSAADHVRTARAGGDCDGTNVAQVWPVSGAVVASTQVVLCVAALAFAGWQAVGLVVV